MFGDLGLGVPGLEMSGFKVSLNVDGGNLAPEVPHPKLKTPSISGACCGAFCLYAGS